MFFVSAELPGTASGENPCARHRRSFSFQWHHNNNLVFIPRMLAHVGVEILAIPRRKHSLGLGAAATRFKVPRQTRRKRETLNELKSAHNYRFYRREGRYQATTERNSGHQIHTVLGPQIGYQFA